MQTHGKCVILTFDDYFDGMCVPRGSDAREHAGVVSARVVNAQPVLEVRVSARVRRPSFWIFSANNDYIYSACATLDSTRM